MGKPKVYPPIIELVGPEAAGKSTLTRLFLEAVPSKLGVLAIDSSTDRSLFAAYGLDSETPTLIETLAKLRDHRPSNSEMDWQFQESIATVGIAAEGHREVLAIGNVPNYGLFQQDSDVLRFELPRLLKQNDLVVMDGELGPFEAFLADFPIYRLMVIRPEDEAYCQGLSRKTAYLILSQASAHDSPPETAQTQIREGNWQLVGRIPKLPSHGDDTPENNQTMLSTACRDSFLHLNLPFQFSL